MNKNQEKMLQRIEEQFGVEIDGESWDTLCKLSGIDLCVLWRFYMDLYEAGVVAGLKGDRSKCSGRRLSCDF